MKNKSLIFTCENDGKGTRIDSGSEEYEKELPNNWVYFKGEYFCCLECAKEWADNSGQGKHNIVVGLVQKW